MEKYINANKLIKFITDGLNNPNKDKAFGHDAIEILSEIEFMGNEDVVKVVKCENCKYFSPLYMSNGERLINGICDFISDENHEEEVVLWHYCSYGRRKNK